MKLDLILENVRNKYSLGLLEESEGLDEKTILQGKILINESTMNIRTILLENGVLETVREYLEEAWTDAVMQAADDTYEGAADTADRVAGGVQGFGRSLGLAGGVAAGYPSGVEYNKVPEFVAKSTKLGYEQGYDDKGPSAVDMAKAGYKVGDTANYIAENPGKSALIGLGGVTAAGLGLGAVSAAGQGARDVSRKVKPYVKSAARDIRAAWKR